MEESSPENHETIEFDGIQLNSKYRDLIADLKKRGITTMAQIRRTALSSFVRNSIIGQADYLREMQICIADSSGQTTFDHEWDDAAGKSVPIEILASEKNIYNFCKGNGIKTLYGLFRLNDKSLNIKNEEIIAFISAVNKMPVSVLAVSDRTVNILRKNGIRTVGQVIVTGTGFISHLPGMSDQELCLILSDLKNLPTKTAYYRQLTAQKPVTITMSDETDPENGAETSITSEEIGGAPDYAASDPGDNDTDTGTPENSENVDDLGTKHAFQEYLKAKGYRAVDIALFCYNLQYLGDTCGVSIFSTDIDTCRQSLEVIKERLISSSLETKSRKEAIEQFEQFLNEGFPEQDEIISPEQEEVIFSEPEEKIITEHEEVISSEPEKAISSEAEEKITPEAENEISPEPEQSDNMLSAYAEELDHFIHEYYYLEKHPGNISAITINGISQAWKKAQAQKFVIQSPSENPLLFSRIAQEFKKVSFLGDIEVSDEEYKVLIYYFRHLSDVEKRNRIYKSTYKMEHDPFFAVILVQIGMRYYNGNYWPDVSKELGKKLDGIKQKELRRNFMSVLDRYGKIHLDSDDFMNIMLHGFVSDHYAPDFFSMLNRYYRIDLHRNLENNTEKMLERMLLRIGENRNNQFVVQTKYAVQNNPERSAEIITDLLYYLDIAFHDNDYQPPVSRMHRLLNQWMQSDEAFQIALRKEERSRTSYQKRFSKPYFYYDNKKETILLVVPPQMVDNEGQETLEWHIKTNYEEFQIPVDILEEGITGAKTDQIKFELPVSKWFDAITMQVIDPVSGKEFTDIFRIPEEPARFFDSSGMSRDPNHMPTGDLTAIVAKGCQIRSNALTDTVHLRTHDIDYLKLEKGDIVHISNGNYYIAGHEFVEGIARSASIRGVTTENDGVQLSIYADLPVLRFKARREMVEGMAINANGIRYSVRNNLPSPIDLGSGQEENGYEIHLSEYLQGQAGRYHIVLDFPVATHNRFFDFIYLPQFSFQFNYQPYIFQEEGSITFSCPDLEITPLQDDIQLNDTGKAFIFPIDKDHLSLLFSALTKDTEIPFSIKVPCLRYSLGNDVWNTDITEFIMLEDLPNDILFDFSDEELTVSLTSKGKESETLVKDSKGIFHYPTNSIKNYAIGDRYKVDVYISSPEILKQFDGKKLLLTVLMRSFVREKRITADFDSGILNGYIDVVGERNYSVDILCNKRKFAVDIPLVDGKFSLEKNIDNGIYQFDVYENEEDEFGLGGNRKLIDSFQYELIDIHNLTGKTVIINRLLVKTRVEPKSYKVQTKLIIRDLVKAGGGRKHCYCGFLDRLNVKVQVIFPDINDLTLAYITYWDEDNKEYFDFEYGTITSRLLLEQEDSWKKGLFDRYLLLNCDENEEWSTPCTGVDMKTIFEVSVE